MSDKFKVIDHETFERMQQSNSRGTPSSSSTQRIRNAKYKRMTTNNHFNLMQFVKIKERAGGVGKKGKIKRRIVDTCIKSKVKKRGKQRENGRRKKPSRLKKSILHYRQLRRGQEKLEDQLVESIIQLTQLTIVEENKNTPENHLVGIHSRRFRDYCNTCTTPELKQYCEQLLRELNRFQRRAYALNEIKARAHRRFVIGFREVQNYIRINKVKLIIIATDCEHNEGEVSIDQTIQQIKINCHDQQIPIVFALQRRQLAYILYKKASISCIGILDYDGARDIFAQLMQSLQDARTSYELLKQNGASGENPNKNIENIFMELK